MKRQVYLVFIAVFILLGCEKETDNFWTITGIVEVTDSQVPSIKSPLEDVKVYLMSAPVMMDTLRNWFDNEIILDSTLTNAKGQYGFKNLSPADYVVMAADSSKGYQFDWSESPDSIWTKSENQQKTYIINFITPEPEEENLFGPYYNFTFHMNNRDEYHHRFQAFRTARENYGCGFMGLSACSWYWEPYFEGGGTLFSVIENKTANEIPLKSSKEDNSRLDWWTDVYVSYEQDDSGTFTDYKDDFHFKFYYDDNLLHTMHISGDNLHDENEFDVYWFEGHVEINRIK